MSVKVYIHIGDARTGTTTFQSIAAKNRARLAKMGVIYPNARPDGKNAPIHHHRLSLCLLPASAPRKTKEAPWQAWEAIAAVINAHDEDDVCLLLSSEAFSSLQDDGIAFVKNFLRDHDVVPIFVRREPENWRRSMWEHRVKIGLAVKEPKGPAKDLGQQKLNRWSVHFDVKCIPYGKNCLTEVFNEIGVNADDLESVPRQNSKLPSNVFAMLSVVNSIPLLEENRRTLKETVADHLPEVNEATMDFLDRVPMDNSKRRQFNAELVRVACEND
jgi:hypothetical protein